MSTLANCPMVAWEVGQWKWIKNTNKSVRQSISHTTIAAIFLVPLCRAVMHTLQKPSLEGKADVVESFGEGGALSKRLNIVVKYFKKRNGFNH